MPDTAMIQTFTFEELSESAKDKVRGWLDEGFDPDWITDQLKEELRQRGLDGLTDKGPWWELYVQGSGVAFEGSIDLSEIKAVQGDGQEDDERHVAAITASLKGRDPNDFSITVEHHGNYSNNMSFDVEVEELSGDEFGEDNGLALGASILDWLRSLSDYLYKLAESEYEYQSSDENIKETCEANGYLFDVTGDPVHHLIGDDKCEHGIAKPWYCSKCAKEHKKQANG